MWLLDLVVKQQGKARMMQFYISALTTLAAACSLAIIYMLNKPSTACIEREPQVLMGRTSADDPIFEQLNERFRPQELASGWWRWLTCLIYGPEITWTIHG
jgi:hypothetical protein